MNSTLVTRARFRGMARAICRSTLWRRIISLRTGIWSLRINQCVLIVVEAHHDRVLIIGPRRGSTAAKFTIQRGKHWVEGKLPWHGL